MSALQQWWRRSTWTQSPECFHVCMLLADLHRKRSASAANIRCLIAAKVAPFLKPPMRDLATGGGMPYYMPDGSGSGFVRFHDSETFVLAKQLTLPVPVCSVAYNPSGARLAIGDVHGTVHLLTVDTLQMRKTKLEAKVKVAFEPHGRYLVAGLYNGNICILDPDTLIECRRVGTNRRCDDGGIHSVAFSPSGDCLAVACFGGELLFFEPDTLIEVRSTRLPEGDIFAAYNPAGDRLAVGASSGYGNSAVLQLLDAGTLAVICGVETAVGSPVCLVYVPGGLKLAVSSHPMSNFSHDVFLHDSETLALVCSVGLGRLVNCLTFVSAGKQCIDAQASVESPVVEAGSAPVDPNMVGIQQIDHGDPAVSGQIDRVEQTSEHKDAELDMVLAQSSQEEELRAQESAYVAEAILRSKTDTPLNSDDGVIVLRLKRMGRAADVRDTLLNSPHLALPRAPVSEAGCELMPSWTPAKLLVPLTHDQVAEARVDLRAHHIVAHRNDFELVVSAFSELPRRRRPTIAAPSGLDLADAVDDEGINPVDLVDGADEDLNVHTSDFADAVLEVEHTFIHFRSPKDISEASRIAESAPCGNSDSIQPANPRRWQNLL